MCHGGQGPRPPSALAAAFAFAKDSTLTHERLHADVRRKETTKTIRETEAEAVAHVVCRALGLDTVEHCADYIQLYDGDMQVLAKSMDYIQKTAASILDGIQTHLSGVDAGPEEVAA